MTVLSKLKIELSEKYKINFSKLMPKNDVEAWSLYPKYNFLYNKMFICNHENIKYAPMPITPDKFPIVIKPIINLLGMGNNAIKINNIHDFATHYNNSHFWCEYLEGKHLSWDLVIRDGQIKVIFCFIGHKNNFGCFNYWRSYKKTPKLPNGIIKLVDKYLSNYTGFLNIETINNKIIEVHLRMGDIDQLPEDKLRTVLLNLIDINIHTKSELNLNFNIYLFPIWQEIKKSNNLEEIYEYLKNKWEGKIIENDNITQYYFDKPLHAYPLNMKRWFLISTNSYRKGLQIKKCIENDLFNKYN
jgi:hypothetical protein